MRTWMRFLPLAMLFLAPVALIRCGQQGATCNAESCADGCCSAEGVCEAGTQSGACGTGGEACTSCLAAGLGTCQAQACSGATQPDAGTDAGTTDAGTKDAGTDAGTDAGADAGVTCTVIDAFTPIEVLAGEYPTESAPPFDERFIAWLGRPAGGGLINELDYDLWKDPDTGDYAPLPIEHTFTPFENFSQCLTCVTYWEGCTPDFDNCSAIYFATGGATTVTERTLDAEKGTFRATAASIHLVEWNFQADQPVPNGKCLELTNLNLDVSWDNTPPVDAGMELDAGMEEPDGGMDQDGGSAPDGG